MKTVNLRPYQLATVEYLKKHKYSIVALDPGLGKTLVSLKVIDDLNLKALVIVPAYLISNWVKEIKKFYPNKEITVFRASKDIYKVWGTDIVVTSYGLLPHTEVLFEWCDAVFFDEAHALKETTTKRSDIAHRFIYENSVKRCYLLTGTPIENRVYELYSLLAICNYNPEITDSLFLNKFPSYVHFADYFSHRYQTKIKTKKGDKWVTQWQGYQNEEELINTYLKDCYVRFSSEEVLQDLPDKVYKDVFIDEKEDPELWEAFLEFSENYSGVSPTIKSQSALEKVPFTVQYCLDLQQTAGKVIVYTDHIESCERLASELGVKHIHGGVDMKKRAEIANDFLYGESNFLVATIGSFSTGVTLIEAHHMVFNDFPWVPGRLRQAEKRIDRIGQTKVCFYHRLFASKQDESIYNRVLEKETTIKAVIK